MSFAIYSADELTTSFSRIGGVSSRTSQASSFLDEEFSDGWFGRDEEPGSICARLLSFFCCKPLKNSTRSFVERSEPGLELQDTGLLLLDLHHNYVTQVSGSSVSDEPHGGQSWDENLLSLLRLKEVHIDAINLAVLRGADPYGFGAPIFDSTSIPLLYVVKRLNEDHEHMNEWSMKLHALLSGHSIKQFNANTRAHIDMVNGLLKDEIGKFGLSQGCQAFEEHGFLWGEICTLLGLKITDLRVGVLPLLQKDLSKKNSYRVRKALQVRFGEFEKFGMACAVNDFMHCLVSSLTRIRVYDMPTFCVTGIIKSVPCKRALEYVAQAEFIQAVLNASAQDQVRRRIASISEQNRER